MNYQLYFWLFLACAILSYLLTLLVIRLADKWRIYDLPSPRKIHAKPIPRLGGLAIFGAFLIIILFSVVFRPDLFHFSPWIWWHVIDKRLFWVILGAIVLVIVGVIDDVKGLNPFTKLFWQIAAAVMVVISGVGIDMIRNPFGGPMIALNQFQIPIHFYGYIYHFVVIGDLFVIFWIVLMINIVNFLDGLDGLAAGVSLIAFLVLFFLSLTPAINQVSTALLCLIIAGTLAGFLPKNFFPAKIFMGDSGSMFLGYMIACLAVISGGKVATSLLVLGFPILDGLWVVGRRLIHKKSPFVADKKHLHHRLLSVGLSQRQVVLIIYAMSAIFGGVALMSQTREKFMALISLIILMVFLGLFLIVIEWKKESRESERK